MKTVSFKDRDVCIESVFGYDCDAYIDSAYYEDTEEELTNDELNELQDTYPEVIEELAFENAIERADFLYD